VLEPLYTRGVAAQTVPLPKVRELYLPDASWTDFWTGKREQGSRGILAAAPLDILPLYVRAGSILPLGPDLEYSDELPADPLEIRVYPGADGAFTLYEDQGDSYDYEKGAYAFIPLAWDDKAQTLTLGAREGSFPGMLEKRTFHVVLVGPGKGIDVEPTPKPDKVVPYEGRAVSVALKP
jgi:alpha-D-xyloside xylohydrolase